eukprot:TRINITY_DN21031_c0_g1_i1.p1 TRINITY_DN21031_c0_g1~~TRINITY_DN21031_c0_g1_i1.p1  ORF type:complete len:329 (+),score=49.19 TRINITY_DN21031_c0_g1_i1:83-1069(+)
MVKGHDPDDCFIDGVVKKEIPNKGNGVVSEKDLPSDCCVAKETPIVWCVDPKYDGMVCTQCTARNVNLTVCEICGYGGQCEECGKAAGNHEGDECKAFALINTMSEKRCCEEWRPNDLILLCRMLVKLYRACDKSHPIWGLSSQSCSDKDKLHFRNTAASIAASSLNVSEDDMKKLVVIIETNSYSVSLRTYFRPLTEGTDQPPPDDSLSSIGIATYYSLSMFNHSCSPNIVKMPDGLTMNLVSISPIKSDTELCHSYVSPQQSTSRRREELYHSWGFECTCNRCSNSTTMWELANICSCGGLYIRDPFDIEVGICHTCGEWADELEQ